MYRRLSFIRQYSSYQKVQGEAVKAKQQQVNDKHKQLQNVKGHKNTLLYKGKQEKTVLEGKQTQQQEMVHGLQKQQKTIQAVIADQRQKDAAINAQIDRLIQQEVAKARAVLLPRLSARQQQPLLPRSVLRNWRVRKLLLRLLQGECPSYC